MKRISFLLFYIIPVAASAQEKLPVAPEFQHAYDKGTRDVSGKPGKNYWQNTAAYNLDVNYDPATRKVTGTVHAVYTNNSPDTLKELWFKLYMNLYKKGYSPKNFKPADIGDGVTIRSFSINKNNIDTSKLITDGTNMHVAINPLMPKSKLVVDISYDYILNKGSHMRTGQVDSLGAAFIAYFFPRIAVYDDIDGWNRYPYRGSEEFYNDFCSFKANITMPGDYLVWATGDLRNAKKVLNKKYIQRINKAEKNDEIVYIIDGADLAAGNITKSNAVNTWKYEAKNVTDLVFAVSNHYLWRSTSVKVDNTTGRRTRVDAVFNPKHADYYEVIDFARKTVDLMSHRFPAWPYPYSHETVFDGLDQMEYPMMVNDNPTESRFDAITLTDHEIFHTMFPFYMGINETKYGWMDEGWATIGEWTLSPMIDDTLKDDYGISATAKISGETTDQPIMTLTTDLKGGSGFTDSYPKPAFGYLFVKDYLGEELFTKALHHYIEQWHGKHPMPYDFFYSMNEGSGKNMDWFWKRWFFDDGAVDMAISSVNKTNDGYTVVVENKSRKPLPVDVTVTYTDGSQGVFHQTIGIWQYGQPTINVLVSTTKSIRKVELGSFYVPDKNPKDNVFVMNN